MTSKLTFRQRIIAAEKAIESDLEALQTLLEQDASSEQTLPLVRQIRQMQSLRATLLRRLRTKTESIVGDPLLVQQILDSPDE
jgi:hypothetical protein